MPPTKPKNHKPSSSEKPPRSTSQCFSVQKLLEKSDQPFRYYTGFDYVRFKTIFDILVPNPEKIPLRYKRSLSKANRISLEDQLLLVLVKLRHDFDFKHLSFLFDISSQSASDIFADWINYMFFTFSSIPIWPHRDVIQNHMPPGCKKDFPNTVVILDATEIKIQKPSSLRTQSQVYSEYKSTTTLKGLIGIEPNGAVIFISTLFSGAISDKSITSQSVFFDTLKTLKENGYLQDGDCVMVDKGFHIQKEVEELGLKLLIPPFATSDGQMSSADVALTKKIARHRVHVERAIARVKIFKIVGNKVDLRLFKSIDQIWFVCSFLTSFMPPLINTTSNV